MKQVLATILTLFAQILIADPANAQGMKLGEVLLISSSAIENGGNSGKFEACATGIVSSWNKGKSGVSMQWFRADRGKRKGQYLLACGAATAKARMTLPQSSPFADNTSFANGDLTCRFSDLLVNPSAYTEYRLIGPEKFQSLPAIGILGIHYIKVKKDREAEFEKFVVEKLHPAVGHVLPDMQLLYYKAVAGENAGSYITVFAIESTAARDKYWPIGSETPILKEAFRPFQSLAQDLGPYLVEGSYLEPSSGGAAAYYESREWTDFILHP